MLAVLLAALFGLAPPGPIPADTVGGGTAVPDTAAVGALDPLATAPRITTPLDSAGRVSRGLPLLAYRLPNRVLTTLPDLHADEFVSLPADSPTAAAISGGTMAALGSLAGGATTLIVFTLATSPGQTVEEGLTGVSAGVVGGLGATAGAALAVAYFGEPYGPRFAGIPVGPNPIAPTDWQAALVGAAIALPVGLLVGGLADQVIQGSGSIGAYAVAVPVAQGIGAALAIARRRVRR